MLSLGKRPLLAAASLFLLPGGAICQAPPHASLQAEANLPKLTRFEVAAIRPNRSNDLVRSFWFTPDGVYIKGFPLHAILHTAFLGLHEYGDDRIIGEPTWVRSERYDIQAKVDEADAVRWRKLATEQQRIALQTLIGERFNLRYHRAARMSSVYVLSIAKGVPRLKVAKLAAASQGPHMFAPLEPGNMQSHSTYMWQLVEELANQLNCIVRDETGLEGTYDYTLEWTPDDQAHAESSGPSLFIALKEQLGLKLEMQKRPVDVVIIDHIERPSPN
jgi:uncharacterized protein (TIGR03435 family)